MLLIVSSSKKSADNLLGLLVPRYFPAGKIVSSAARARRELNERDYRLVLVNAPLQDEAGDALARDILHTKDADVILLAGEDIFAVKDNVDPEPLLIFEKPINRILLEKALQVLQFAHERSEKLRAENRKLSAKLEESRLVGRAKCALIEYRQMTESEAHHYIERMAMDARQPKKEIARDILRTFDV